MLVVGVVYMRMDKTDKSNKVDKSNKTDKSEGGKAMVVESQPVIIEGTLTEMEEREMKMKEKERIMKERAMERKNEIMGRSNESVVAEVLREEEEKKKRGEIIENVSDGIDRSDENIVKEFMVYALKTDKLEKGSISMEDPNIIILTEEMRKNNFMGEVGIIVVIPENTIPALKYMGLGAGGRDFRRIIGFKGNKEELLKNNEKIKAIKAVNEGDIDRGLSRLLAQAKYSRELEELGEEERMVIQTVSMKVKNNLQKYMEERAKKYRYEIQSINNTQNVAYS
jgi:hypothetical protein